MYTLYNVCSVLGGGKYRGGYHDVCGGYLEYRGGYLEYCAGVQYRGGYHEYRGGCSIPWGTQMTKDSHPRY